MRQVTGRTNRPNDRKKVSIQLALDGHSFSVPTEIVQIGDTQPAIEEVELLSPATLLVPRELFAAEHTEQLFAATGCGVPQEAEYVICTAAERPDVVAVVAAPRESMAQLRGVLPDVRYTTPLLLSPTVTAPVIAVCDVGALIYIKVYDPQLSLAEVVATEATEEVEYLIRRLAAQYDPKLFTLELDLRNGDKKRLKQYKSQFKRVVCV